MIVYVCEDTPDGIFTAVYDAWAARIPNEQLKLRVEMETTLELFAQYRYVQTDPDKAVKVARSVARKVGREAYERIYTAALSDAEDKVDAIYHFLKLGFVYGPKVNGMHGQEPVCRVFELGRKVWNEAHLFHGFVRFQDTPEQILLARISPKAQVLPLLGDHFADRFPGEHFVILDDAHGYGVFHEKNRPWYLAPLEKDKLEQIWAHRTQTGYEELWQTFFDTIAIRERENPVCQRTMCALRYRQYMTEFQ